MKMSLLHAILRQRTVGRCFLCLFLPVSLLILSSFACVFMFPRTVPVYSAKKKWGFRFAMCKISRYFA